MGYRELEQCKDFDKLKAVFDDDMLGYFERQLESYLNGSRVMSGAACWYEGMITTEAFIDEYR
ncbi:hypothetical protein SAMN05443270_4612 [Lacrimispora sphenoides]|jgi:hypothetical protein|uniref:hypothetical protein n=1 Tax=Lacrimispora sphenoides TaxID=29370 RepID=UPI0008D6A30A|nr:hypothetical protein [Lacrimispora sphenoides]SEU28766.1 hypothetical protein SAMN05443270_4612 [Lacrimispora sphenoides]